LPLGALGHLGTYSFHDTKNYICGEGGALAINSPEMIERAEVIREKGTNRSQFFRGEVDKYTWVDVGSSYLPSEIACAFLYAQLEAMDTITERRRQVYEFYSEHLSPLEEQGLLGIPSVPRGCQINYHLFYILLDEPKTRDGLMAYLKEKDIQAVFHYVPLHTSPMGNRFGYSEGDLPLTENLSARLLRLPFYYDITEEEQMRVVNRVAEYLQRSLRERS
jgi:dTDP-4-amino-4,6-dideoxygalactose transaminase